MSVMDFLFEGQPPPSVTTYGTRTENLPQWMSDYAQNLITRANAVGMEPYQAYPGPRLAGFTPEQLQAFGEVPGAANAYQPYLSQAGDAAKGALTQAQPYINAAAQTFPGAVDQYMNPYVEKVVNRASTLTNRALNEQLLPSVARVFGAAGQDARSSAYRRAVDTGVRDLAEGLQTQAQGALSQAYESAGQMFGQDAARNANLAATVGNLGLGASQQQGVLAELAQRLGLTGAAALETVGQEQQQQQQRGLDLAYQDFQNQRDYPRQTLDWMSGILQGTPHSTQNAVSETGPAQIYQPSPIAQAGSAATGIAGLISALKQKSRGGRVRYKRGGRVRGRGALRELRYA